MFSQFMLTDPGKGGLPHLRIPRAGSHRTIVVAKRGHESRGPNHLARVVILKTDMRESQVVILKDAQGEYFLPEYRTYVGDPQMLEQDTAGCVGTMCGIRHLKVEKLYRQTVGDNASRTAFLAHGYEKESVRGVINYGRWVYTLEEVRLTVSVCDRLFRPHHAAMRAALLRLMEDGRFLAANKQLYGILRSRHD